MQSFEQIKLDTERLLIRPTAEGDVEALYAIFSDPTVMKYWSTTPWETLQQAKDSITRASEALHTGEYLQLGIERKANAQLIGTCTLFNFNHQCKRAEMGYALAQSAWGHGFMHEALSALVKCAFTQLDLHRIEAEIDPRNVASAKSLERLGFVEEGYLRDRWIVNDEVSDSRLYGLLSKEWRS